MTDFPSTISDLLLWIDGRAPAYTDSAGTIAASAFTDRIRRVNYGAPAVGNAQSASDGTRPFYEPGALNFQVGAGSYLHAPVAADCLQTGVTVAVNFTARDRPEASDGCLICNGTVLKVLNRGTDNPAVNYNNTGAIWLPDPSLVIPLGAQATMIVRMSATAIKCTLVIDGVRTDYSTTVTVNATTLTAANWYLGWDGSTAGDERFHGAISQGIVVPHTLTDPDNDSLVTFMVANPAPHFCPTGAALVGVSGDSIARGGAGFYGVAAAQTWAMMAQQGLNAAQPVNLINAAISGDGIIHQRDTIFPLDLGPFYSSARARNVYVLAIGTNDMATSGHDGPTALADYYRLADNVLALGGRVVVHTILPRNLGSSTPQTNFNAARAYFNTHLRAEWAARGYHALADQAAISGMGADGDEANAAYYNNDQIHPNTNGHATLLPVYQAAIQLALNADPPPPVVLVPSTAVAKTRRYRDMPLPVKIKYVA